MRLWRRRRAAPATAARRPSGAGEWLLAAIAFVLRMLGGGPRRGAGRATPKRRRLVWARGPSSPDGRQRRSAAALRRLVRRR